jgi:WD40 repeat protein
MNIESYLNFIILQIFTLHKLKYTYSARIENGDHSMVHAFNIQGNTFSFVNLPNGLLATASSNGFIQIWNVEEGFLVRTLQSSTNFTTISQLVLQDQYLVIATITGNIQIWDSNDYIMVDSIKVAGEQEIFSLVFLENGTLFIATVNGIKIFDRLSEPKIKTWSNRLVYLLAVLNKDLLAAVSVTNNIIYTLNTTTENVLHYFSTGSHTNYVRSIVLLPNGFLASGSWDNTIKIWDLYRRILVKTLEGHNSIGSLAVTKNGLLVSLVDNAWIKIWKPRDGFELQLVYFVGFLDYLTVTYNGYLAGTMAFYKKMYVWNWEKFNYDEKKTLSVDLGKNLVFGFY